MGPIEAFPKSPGGDPDAARGIASSTPRSLEAATELTHFETNASGGIVGGVKTTVGAAATTFERFDLTATGCVRACAKTTVEGPLTNLELFDPRVASGSAPGVTLASERLADGRLGRVEVVLQEPDLSLVLRVGRRTYRLIARELKEETS
jgi:hypothetical protein